MPRKTKKSEMMGVTTVLNCAGVDKDKFIDYTEKNPATYRLVKKIIDREINR